MKKIFLLTLMTMCLTLVFSNDAYSQRRGKKKKKKTKTDQYFDDSGDLKSRLWYGGNLGGIVFSNGVFGGALSPMAGYKITDKLSAGLIAKVDFTYFDEDAPGIKNPSLTDLSLGAIVRYRVIPVIFVHAEFEGTRFEGFTDGVTGGYNKRPSVALVGDGKFLKSYVTQPYFYTGLGYQSGNGIVGYEISILYNVIDDFESIRSPFDLRFGLNYNF